MSAYLLGNLIGRLALSYVLVWFVIWLMLTKRSWRDTFKRASHWSSLTATTALFLLGVAQ